MVTAARVPTLLVFTPQPAPALPARAGLEMLFATIFLYLAQCAEQALQASDTAVMPVADVAE
jgi:hypothetical protein